MITSTNQLPSQEDTVNGNATATLPVVEDTHIPVGSLVTVTIGRNVGTTPMVDAVWDTFRAQVRTVLSTLSDDVFGPFDGVGEWDGVREESTTFTAVTNVPGNPSTVDEQLAMIAGWYAQDAIAWSYGAGRLARP